MSDSQSVAPTTRPITTADAKRQLNVSHSNDDTFIDDCIDAATAYVEEETQKALIIQTRVLKMQTFSDPRYVHGRIIFLPRAPLVTASTTGLTIAYVDSPGSTQSLASTEYRGSTGDIPGRIAEEYSKTWPDTRNVQDDVTITYQCGFGSTQSSVPANLRHAVRLLTGHFYRNREATAETMSRDLSLGVDALLNEHRAATYG